MTDNTADHADAEAADWLARLRAPEGAGAQAAFEEWFMADPAHADAYERTLAAWEASGALNRTPIGEARDSLTSPQPARPRRWLVAVATVLLAVIVGGGFGIFQFGRGSPSLVTAAYASDIGMIRVVRLSDQSVVTLDSDSQVQVRYDDHERRLVLLRGRARFATVSNPKRDFVVSVGTQRIRGNGAVFDVDLASGAAAVFVLKGRAALDNGNGSSKVLAAGQASRAASAAGWEADVGVNQADTRWPSGMVSFENAPLADVVARANRYARAQITLTDESVGALRFTGTFNPTATGDLARMLAATFKLSLSKDARGNFALGREAPTPVK